MNRKHQALRDSVEGQYCCNCEWSESQFVRDGLPGNETVVLAHLPPRGESGMGMKGADWFAAGLCFECHQKADTDPAYIHDSAWRSRMVYRQLRIWVENGQITFTA